MQEHTNLSMYPYKSSHDVIGSSESRNDTNSIDDIWWNQSAEVNELTLIIASKQDAERKQEE